MTIDTEPFDPAAYLEGEERIAAYLEDTMESGDAGVIADALGVVARARGLTEVARDAGLSRDTLHRSLTQEGHPELETVVRVLRALGLRLSLAPVAPTA